MVFAPSDVTDVVRLFPIGELEPVTKEIVNLAKATEREYPDFLLRAMQTTQDSVSRLFGKPWAEAWAKLLGRVGSGSSRLVQAAAEYHATVKVGMEPRVMVGLADASRGMRHLQTRLLDLPVDVVKASMRQDAALKFGAPGASEIIWLGDRLSEIEAKRAAIISGARGLLPPPLKSILIFTTAVMVVGALCMFCHPKKPEGYGGDRNLLVG